MRFQISPVILSKLRALRAQQPGKVDGVTEREDAYILDPGMGPVG